MIGERLVENCLKLLASCGQLPGQLVELMDGRGTSTSLT
jgi:hypothetical protein